jgi:hypothetical protein
MGTAIRRRFSQEMRFARTKTGQFLRIGENTDIPQIGDMARKWREEVQQSLSISQVLALDQITKPAFWKEAAG